MEEVSKIFVSNRHGKKLAVIVDKPKNPQGLAFVLHGLGGFKEQKPIEIIAKVFFDNGYTTVRYDSSHTIGESEGDYGDANVTNHIEDLEDIIDWASRQDWYIEPFCLSGHSLGGGCVMWYATDNPEKVKGLAPVATTASGEIVMSRYREDDLAIWDKTDIQEVESVSKPGVIKRLNWAQFKDDIMNYDIFTRLDKMTMPLLLLVGEKDKGTSPEDHKRIFAGAAGKNKKLKIIKGADHDFRRKQDLKEIYKIFDNWINNL